MVSNALQLGFALLLLVPSSSGHRRGVYWAFMTAAGPSGPARAHRSSQLRIDVDATAGYNVTVFPCRYIGLSDGVKAAIHWVVLAFHCWAIAVLVRGDFGPVKRPLAIKQHPLQALAASGIVAAATIYGVAMAGA